MYQICTLTGIVFWGTGLTWAGRKSVANIVLFFPSWSTGPGLMSQSTLQIGYKNTTIKDEGHFQGWLVDVKIMLCVVTKKEFLLWNLNLSCIYQALNATQLDLWCHCQRQRTTLPSTLLSTTDRFCYCWHQPFLKPTNKPRLHTQKRQQVTQTAFWGQKTKECFCCPC